MVKVNFYINGKFLLADSFDKQPLVRADYVFDGIKYQVGSVTSNDDGSFNYHLSVAAKKDVYDIKEAHQILSADKNTDVVMPDGQVVPSVAKAIGLVTRNS